MVPKEPLNVKNFRKALREIGFTLPTFIEATNFTKVQVYGWVHGDSTPGDQDIEYLMFRLDKSREYLFEKVPQRKPKKSMVVKLEQLEAFLNNSELKDNELAKHSVTDWVKHLNRPITASELRFLITEYGINILNTNTKSVCHFVQNCIDNNLNSLPWKKIVRL